MTDLVYIFLSDQVLFYCMHYSLANSNGTLSSSPSASLVCNRFRETKFKSQALSSFTMGLLTCSCWTVYEICSFISSPHLNIQYKTLSQTSMSVTKVCIWSSGWKIISSIRCDYYTPDVARPTALTKLMRPNIHLGVYMSKSCSWDHWYCSISTWAMQSYSLCVETHLTLESTSYDHMAVILSS